MKNGYSIGEIAHAAGIATSAVRYYERVGLLPAAARMSGRRVYSREVLSRLGMIQLSKEMGFSLPEIRTLVEGITLRETSPKEFKELAREKLPEVEAMIQRAQLIRRVLRSVDRCQCPTLEQCVSGAQKAGLIQKFEL